MKTLKATLELYRAAIRDGARAYTRGIVGAFGLLLGSAFLLLVSKVFGPLMAAGGVVGVVLFRYVLLWILTSYVIGAYLACVEAALDARRMLPPSVLRDAVGRYSGECRDTLFWVLIGRLFLGFVIDGYVALAVWFVLSVLFNPIPELLYNKRTSAPTVFKESAQWVWSNWPEWFAPHLIVVLVALFVPALSAVLFTGGWMGLSAFGMVASSARSAADYASSGDAPLWRVVLGALLVPLIIHAVMVFRGALFRRLDRGNRRGRAWQARFDELGTAARGLRTSRQGKAGTVFALSQYRAEQVVRGLLGSKGSM